MASSTTETVEASIGFTKNLGNFENAKVDARKSKTVSGEVTQEDWDEVWADVEAQVEQKLVEIAEAIDGG